MRALSIGALTGLALLGVCAVRAEYVSAAPVRVGNVLYERVPAQSPAPSPSTPQPPRHAPGPAPKLDVAYLTGNWTSEGDCAQSIRFGADGVTEGSTWTLRGNQIVVTTRLGDQPPIDVRVLSRDIMLMGFAGMGEQEFIRCPF